MLLGIAPYLFAFTHQSRDKQLLSAISQRLLNPPGPDDLPARRAWFTDGLNDVNGVTRVVRRMGELAAATGDDLTLISIADRAPDWSGRVKHFTPVGQFSLPENENVTLAFPPFLDVLEYCDRENFTELIVSTPGPAGLAALAAGKALNLKLVGIYHTDLPQYIRYYTEDEALESASWRYLRWFYEQMDVIYVPSRAYQRALEAKGFAPEKLRLFPHGTDPEKFHPGCRDEAFWGRYAAATGPTVTYVGRVAKEKDLDVLVDVFTRLAQARPDCTLAVVGDGPFLPVMKQRLKIPQVVFTGFLFDADLSRAYASSDVFVFPSPTDTFGNVVLEAMASGVPVVVSDRGGPCEIVEHGRTGLVTKARNAMHLVAAVERLLDDHDLRRAMSAAGRHHAEAHGWDRLYREFWDGLGTHGTDVSTSSSPSPYELERLAAAR